jgi:hypothetical protein
VLSSLAFDWALRLRLGGTNLNGFVLADCVLPRLSVDARARNWRGWPCSSAPILPWHAELWQQATDEGFGGDPPALDPAVAPCADDTHRRAGRPRPSALSGGDVAWITRGCDQPAASLRGRALAALPAKGFWRVDRTLEPALRQPMRWLAAPRFIRDT